MGYSPITLDALQALDAIDRRGSFAKAAEELNKATSALSYTVQKLEDIILTKARDLRRQASDG